MATLPFDPAALAPADRALYDAMVARRRAQGAPFDGPYLPLMNHPQLCQRIEALGYYLKFDGHLPRDVYQFVVLAVARATGAAFEWEDHVAHARAAGVPDAVISALHGQGLAGAALPLPYAAAAAVLARTLAWQDMPRSRGSASKASWRSSSSRASTRCSRRSTRGSPSRAPNPAAASRGAGDGSVGICYYRTSLI